MTKLKTMILVEGDNDEVMDFISKYGFLSK